MADQQLDGKRLYYGQPSVFLLTIGTDIFQIDEPIGWDKILVQITFDTTLKGFKFEFSDKDVTLEFDTIAGFEKLRDLYAAKGVDSQASLKFGQIYSGNTVTVLYESRLDFSTYLEGIFSVKLQSERQSLAVKFMSRRETEFEIEQTSTLGGLIQNLPQLPVYNCFLHPPFLNSQASFIYNKNIPPGDPSGPPYNGADDPPLQLELNAGLRTVLTAVPPLQAVSNEVDGLEEPLTPNGELIYAGLTLPNGIVKKNISLKGTVVLKTNWARGPFGTNCKFGVRIYKKIGISTGTDDNAFNDLPHTVIYYDQFFLYPNIDDLNFTNHQFDFDVVAELRDDEALFIKAYIDMDTPGGPRLLWGQTPLWNMQVKNYDFTRPTVFPAYKIKDVLARMTEMVTDQNASFKSDFFTTGLGKDHFMNSGKQLRSIPGAPLVNSLKSVLPSCDALWNMGGTFERDNFGGEWFRYEPMEFFFRDIEMIKLDIISQYVKTPALENTFNELEFGFKKYPQGNETGSAFDFMTKFNWITSIQTYKQKLSRICEFLLSPYYISYAIQNSFEVNQTKQFDTDNDTFLISHRENTENDYTGQVTFDATSKQIIFPTGVPIIKGETILIAGTTSNDGNKVVDDVVWDNLNGTVRTIVYLSSTAAIIDEDALGATVQFSEKWIPKRDEQFDIINGVDAPQTVYNLQHHIKVIFKRWSKYFLGGLIYTKDDPLDSTLIKYMSSSNNKMVETTLKNTEPQTPMSPVFRAANPTSPDIDRTDERPSDLQYPLFGKSKITFVAPMTWQLLDRLRKAFEGRDPDGKDYGYFTILNPYGVYEKGYLQDMTFNPDTQSAKIELIEKYNG